MKNFLVLGSTFIFTLLNSMTSKADVLSAHGMVLFGDQATYASHLPMFHAPHDQQAVFQITLENSGRKPTVELYEELKKSTNVSSLFTLLPAEFNLSELITSGNGKIAATLYHGHFEKGGTPIGPLYVHVSKVIYSKKLSRDSLPNGNFIVFGSGDEHYAVKEIGSVGSYDAIVSVENPVKSVFAGCQTRLCDGGIFEWIEIPDFELPTALKAQGLISSEETAYQYEIPSKGVILSDEKKLKGNAPPPPCNPCAMTTIKDVVYSSKDDLLH